MKTRIYLVIRKEIIPGSH